jgi:hypothetical protein
MVAFGRMLVRPRVTADLVMHTQLTVTLCQHLATSVPGRPLVSVHAHVRRAYDPSAKKGNWTRDEDDELRA